MIKEPKDLGVKIGTKKEILWGKVIKEAEILIEQSEDNLIIQKKILKMAKWQLQEEKQQFNKK